MMSKEGLEASQKLCSIDRGAGVLDPARVRLSREVINGSEGTGLV